MGVTNRDASLTTQRRKQLALYSWRLSDQYPQNPQSIRPEQANSAGFQQKGPTGDVATQARLGAALVGQTPGSTCPCTGVTLQGYDKKSPAC